MPAVARPLPEQPGIAGGSRAPSSGCRAHEAGVLTAPRTRGARGQEPELLVRPARLRYGFVRAQFRSEPPMWPAPTTQRLRSMISQAMQDQAPKMFSRVQKAGLLEQEIDSREELAREANAVAVEAPGSPYSRAQTPQEFQQAASQAWDQAMQV